MAVGLTPNPLANAERLLHRLYETFDEGSDFYIVTELVEGGELFDRIVSKAHYTEKEARDLIKSLLETLNYMHTTGVVHRDLKPENLLLCSGALMFLRLAVPRGSVSCGVVSGRALVGMLPSSCVVGCAPTVYSFAPAALSDMSPRLLQNRMTRILK
jgi:serine/threonine protein kinase